MSFRVLLEDHPLRTIALATEDHVLVFRYSLSGVSTNATGSTTSLQSQHQAGFHSVPKCMVEFSELSSFDLSGYRSLRSAHGTLGLVTLEKDVFLCVITGSSQVATVRPGETVQRIHSVEFYCLNRADYDPGYDSEFSPYGSTWADDTEFNPSLERDPLEHPFAALKKLLSGGNFYYSVDFDLTKRLQDRSSDTSAVDIESLDEGLLWNSYMIGPLLQFRSRLSRDERLALDASQLLTSVIRGFVKTFTVPASAAPLRRMSDHLPSTITLISRLSSRRAGTRFNSRGIDDDGNVANFVESETVFWSPSGVCFSYAQIRGSVPIFWEQATGLLPGQQKITITRSPEATQPAFDKHFESLELTYGAIHVLNLLSETRPAEADLSRRYHLHIERSPLRQSGGKESSSSDHDLLRETAFDFHAETKGPGGYESASLIRHKIEHSADGFAYYLSEEAPDPSSNGDSRKSGQRSVVVLQQEGVFRTNCLDCLDRTNLVQTIISQMALEVFARHQRERISSDFLMRHSTLWADNGDALSKIYAGTGALKSSFTRHGRMSLAGAIADARKSATRLYMNNFADKSRQQTIDLLLGRLMWQTPVHLFDPINDYVTAELHKRASEYSSSKTINIWVGTFNLNGKAHGAAGDLSPWLCPSKYKEKSDSEPEPDIMAVAFQEIVELSPQQIMATDPARLQTWQDAVKRTINDSSNARGTEYVLLRSGQLVGAALMIFVKADALRDIKNVEGGIKKTGLSGIAGNKGAVAIRLDFCNTSLCFVTAHLAAGFSNYEERNRDFKTISHGLRFQKNRSIDDHDTIIYFGDFNYRIGLSDEKVRKLISQGDLETLYENDQLNLQMVAGLTFPFYSEARIFFNPTYKYNNGTDEYDTSDKARIPAWCDRILRKGTNLRQKEYSDAPLRFSDHRPVYATFQCTISVINEVVKGELSRQIYQRRSTDLKRTIAASNGDDSDSDDSDDDPSSTVPIAPGLPPASSETKKWWLDNGRPARSTIAPPSQNLMLNPERPSNPYTPTSEPDWVEKPPPTPARRPATPGGRNPVPPPSRAASTASDRGPPGRMLPPPYDGPRKISETPPKQPPRPPQSQTRSRDGDGAGDGDVDEIINQRTTFKTLSRSSSTSTSTFTSNKKPPPPKPKKPELLSSTSTTTPPPPQDDNRILLHSSEGASASGSPSPTKAQAQAQAQAPGPPLPPPARRSKLSSSTSNNNSASPAPAPAPAPGSRPSKATPPPVKPRNPGRRKPAFAADTDDYNANANANANDDIGPPLPPRTSRTSPSQNRTSTQTQTQTQTQTPSRNDNNNHGKRTSNRNRTRNKDLLTGSTDSGGDDHDHDHDSDSDSEYPYDNHHDKEKIARGMERWKPLVPD